MSTEKKVVRKALETDADALFAVLTNGFHFHEISPDSPDKIDPEIHSDVLVLENDMTVLDLEHAFVAELGGVVVGFCHYKKVNEHEAKTTLLTVLPEHRSKGIGGILQEARMREAYEAGIHKLVTYTENPNSITWYQKHFGYLDAGEVPIHHRLYALPIKGGVRWGIHYGFLEYALQHKLECNLSAYFGK